jgi:cell division protein FtsB
MLRLFDGPFGLWRLIMHRLNHRFLQHFAVTLLTLVFLPVVLGAELKDSLGVVSNTNRSAVASQEKIDALSRETQILLEEYRKLQDGSEYQAAYTRELEELDRTQQRQIQDLQEQIVQARITRQRIVPLMRSMVDALEKFVVLDLPFQHEERIHAVLQLKQRLNQPDLSVSAKFRLLLEAYQLEQNYGGNMAAWRGPLLFQGEELSVEYLRVGRTALYFQSLDGETSGYWNAADDGWMTLAPEYNRELSQALRSAKNLTAPQLLQLPLMAPGGDS